jgi:hypothetical protein
MNISHLHARKRIMLIAAIVLILAALTVSMVAASGVTLLTPPYGTTDLYYDANGDGAVDASEYVGTFPVYDGQQLIEFSWAPYAFPAGANGSYRVSLWQNFGAPGQPDWHEFHVSHTWADNPAGTTFSIGPFFNQENICKDCPSMIVVVPETYVYRAGEFLYTPVAGAVMASLTDSDEFLLENLGDLAPGVPHNFGKPG